MLGSVYERVREIGIFSSVGLAPAHVGALFLAEASVYAVMGAIIGYLIAQAKAQADYDAATATGQAADATDELAGALAVMASSTEVTTTSVETVSGNGPPPGLKV